MNALLRPACCLTAVLALLLAVLPRPAVAHTPESPEVRAVIKKGLKYLETAKEGRLGGQCLIALAFLKDGADEKHPKVVAAVNACIANTKGEVGADIYSTGIAIIFLCTLNPSKYQPEIVKLRDSLEDRQKSCGGWGYPDKQTGDTSMTQYGMLSYWEMSAVGIPINNKSVERVTEWLIRTQDPNGNWGYQGKEAEDTNRMVLVKQDTAAPGMSSAGLGCTYMAGDLLGLGELHSDLDSKLPPALRLIKGAAVKKGPVTNVDGKLLRAAQERGKAWLFKNYKIDPPGFTHYYLYALERCRSFMEAAAGRSVKEPTWYNDGYDYLKKTQKPNGSWQGTEGLDDVNTAFAVLFLLRSTKKAIERAKSYGDGALLAGRGLPTEVQEVRVRGGQVAAKRLANPTSELIDILTKPDHSMFAAVVADVDLLTARLKAAKPDEKKELLSRMRMLAATGVPDARVTAVRVLSQLRDIESCPALLAALDDPDWQVVLSADEGLQFMGWKTAAVNLLGDKPDNKARAAAKERWKTWYLTVRPDAELE
ncbi:MAG: hypothetical protein ACKVP0_07345 [Pirellulaceae bacterium]